MGVTKFGEFIRKLRIEKGEILKDMAKKLAVSSAFLSAVENGKKQIPIKWIDDIPKIYGLNKEEIIKLKNSIELSKDKYVINTKDASDQNKELAMIFARSFGELDDDVVENEVGEKVKKKSLFFFPV